MPDLGREIASLDFANLIGGPLNAVVEAQAKSAITTVNFIKEVAFKDGKVINVNFKYGRLTDDGKEEDFELNVPLLVMLPVPYISIKEAEIDFNAKITSINESKMGQNFEHLTEGEASSWYMSANLKSKTTYQRTSGESDEEQRTFDMHVRVKARNQDMPAGTERLLTILESSIGEKKGKVLEIGGLKITSIDGAVDISGPDSQNILVGSKFVATTADSKVEGKIINITDGKFAIDYTTNIQNPLDIKIINPDIKTLEEFSQDSGCKNKLVVTRPDISGIKGKECYIKIGGTWRSGKVEDKAVILTDDLTSLPTKPIEIHIVPEEPKTTQKQSVIFDSIKENPASVEPGSIKEDTPITKTKKISSAEAVALVFEGTISKNEMKELINASFDVANKTFKLIQFDSTGKKWMIDPALDESEQESLQGKDIILTLALAEKKS